MLSIINYFKIAFRCLTFVINAFVLRHVSQNEIGVSNVRLLLLESTVLFLSREAFRRACLTDTVHHNWRRVINLIWLSYVIALDVYQTLTVNVHICPLECRCVLVFVEYAVIFGYGC